MKVSRPLEAGCLDLVDELVRGRVLNIQKCNSRILHCERLDDRLADPARTTCHYDDAIVKTWVGSHHVNIQPCASPFWPISMGFSIKPNRSRVHRSNQRQPRL